MASIETTVPMHNSQIRSAIRPQIRLTWLFADRFLYSIAERCAF